jgi:hypothetical protein
MQECSGQKCGWMGFGGQSPGSDELPTIDGLARAGLSNRNMM